jgi:hypothetical protein
MLSGAAPSESYMNHRQHRRRLPTKATTNLDQTNLLASIGDKNYFQAAKVTHTLLHGSFTCLVGRSAFVVQRMRAHMRAVEVLIGSAREEVAFQRFSVPRSQDSRVMDGQYIERIRSPLAFQSTSTRPFQQVLCDL